MCYTIVLHRAGILNSTLATGFFWTLTTQNGSVEVFNNLSNDLIAKASVDMSEETTKDTFIDEDICLSTKNNDVSRNWPSKSGL